MAQRAWTPADEFHIGQMVVVTPRGEGPQKGIIHGSMDSTGRWPVRVNCRTVRVLNGQILLLREAKESSDPAIRKAAQVVKRS